MPEPLELFPRPRVERRDDGPSWGVLVALLAAGLIAAAALLVAAAVW